MSEDTQADDTQAKQDAAMASFELDMREIGKHHAAMARYREFLSLCIGAAQVECTRNGATGLRYISIVRQCAAVKPEWLPENVIDAAYDYFAYLFVEHALVPFDRPKWLPEGVV